jgi:outer membrane protein assembly factor BamD (BamD/ComL family)
MHRDGGVKGQEQKESGRRMVSYKRYALLLLCLIAGCLTNAAVSPREHWKHACVAYRAEDYPGAIVHFEALLQHESAPTNTMPAVLYYAGQAYMKTGQHEKAYQSFKKLTWDYPTSIYAKRGHPVRPYLLKTTDNHTQEGP